MCGMRVISRKKLREYSERFFDAKAQLDAWYHEAKEARWKTPADIKEKYGTASILKNKRVVFNICGNKYRLIVRINFYNEIVYLMGYGGILDWATAHGGFFPCAAAGGFLTFRREPPLRRHAAYRGAVAQLGERYNGIVEVVGSIPSGSTNIIKGLARNG